MNTLAENILRMKQREWIHLRDLILELVARNIKIIYKGSVIGIAWSLIHPLAQLLIYYFLFQKVIALKINRYSLFTFCGLIVWNWFLTSVSQGAVVIVASRELIRQPNFKLSILPIVTVLTNGINFVLSLVVLFFVLILTGTVPGISLVGLPMVIAIQFVLTTGIVYFLAAMNVVFRDTQHLVTVILQMFFFITPIFYDISSVPVQYRAFYSLNPMTHIISAYRTIIMTGAFPEWSPLFVISIFSVILLWIGLLFFQHMSCRFIDEL